MISPMLDKAAIFTGFRMTFRTKTCLQFLAVLVKVYIHQFARIKSEKITLIYGTKG